MAKNECYNELPPWFETWRDFYMEVLRHNVLQQPEIKDIQYSDMRSPTIYFVNVEFLKARMFEEIQPDLEIDYEFIQKCRLAVVHSPMVHNPEKLLESFNKINRLIRLSNGYNK